MMMVEWDKSPELTLLQAKQDASIGIEADMPEELKVAIRNMGPLTRKRFFKKLNNEKLSEKQYQQYIEQFAK